MKLASGTTHLPLDRSFELNVAAADALVVELPVAKIDAAVTGRVMDPAGNLLENARVYARGESAELKQVFIQSQTDGEGRYYIQLPHGGYTLWTDLGQTGQTAWVSPADQSVTIGVKGIRPGINFQFQQPDVTLSGDLLMADGSPFGHTAKLWAVSGTGEFVTGTVSANWSFSLPLIAQHGWYIHALAERDGMLYRAEQPLTIATDQSLNLRFAAGAPIPSPQIYQFDAAKLAKITINDDMTVLIPANTLPVSGPVMLVATPIPAMA